MNDDKLKDILETFVCTYQLDNYLNTPDFMVADCIFNYLKNLKGIIDRRDKWFGNENHLLDNDNIVKDFWFDKNKEMGEHDE
jgi:hypothetical protein